MYDLENCILLPETTEEYLGVQLFHKAWYGNDLFIETNTSGSTGTPKTIRLEKKHMLGSALATIDFFKFNQNTSACLCLNPSTIGGKMMLVRVFEANMKLIVAPVRSMFFADIHFQVDFVALVPMQIEQIMRSGQQKYFSTFLVGGAPISQNLESKIIQHNLNCFGSFGMTETISHIALRKLSTKNEPYFAMPNVQFSEHNGTLVITAKHLGLDGLETTDLVDLVDATHFYWLGRSDFVINSGGKKIHPELLENQISTVVTRPFFIFGQPHSTLGEEVCMAVESRELLDIESIKHRLSLILSKHEVPKRIFVIRKFRVLPNNKIDRKQTILNMM
jgi:o-succinylbenzoate---CoA ligase